MALHLPVGGMTGTIATTTDCRQVHMEISMTMTAREMDEREFGSLIGSDKVEGTAVYGPDDTEIGAIERVMIDKLSGRVSYAVLGFGGILGLGNDHYPCPGSR
jgi:PRC-barrel domain